MDCGLAGPEPPIFGIVAVGPSVQAGVPALAEIVLGNQGELSDGDAVAI